MSARLTVPVSTPYDWAAIRGFLAARAIPGVEAVAEARYRRSVVIAGRPDVLRVEPDEAGRCTALVVRLESGADAQPALTRLRRLFDADCDPAAIGAHLARDPVLAGLVAARPGLRLPGAWDGFEMAVRAILGQQVSVGAATRLAGKLVAAFGERLPEALCTDDGPTRLFPAPDRIATADIASALGMPGARGRAISGLAQALLAEPDLLDPGRPLDAALARLKALPGIGDWTAQYVAMRALREADAMPTGDVGLMRALDRGDGRPSAAALTALSAAWSPWRAYAALHLWAHDSARQDGSAITEQGAG